MMTTQEVALMVGNAAHHWQGHASSVFFFFFFWDPTLPNSVTSP